MSKKIIVGDFYFVDQFISNINTNKFTNKKTRQTKKITNIILSVILWVNMSYYQQIKPFVILLEIFFHITNRWNPTNILLMAFHVIIFNSMEFYDGLSLSIIPSVMCLIFFKNQIQINKLEKN